MTLKLSLQAQWKSWSSREKQMVIAASMVVLCAIFWWLGLAPALQILRHADSRHQALGTQIQTMLRLQNQAQQLKNQPKISYQDATRELEVATTRHLGTAAQLEITQERATISLKQVPAEALATWLNQIRVNARATPTEVQLTQAPKTNTPASAMASPNPPPSRLVAIQGVNLGAAPTSAAPQNAATNRSAEVQWNGTVVLRLPSPH